ncbi:acetate kinase [Synchytrium endobioticum]|uniref:Acetate kinase n=1 Tax=Synchytrium endobioticum TaxID=286115 RepID=A0A507D9N5_9FUNG|nr:acetate kinase [Synchytrium endobioticum]
MVRGTELTSFDSCDYTRRIAAVPIPFDIVKTHLQSELRLALRCVPPRYDDLSTYTSTINGWTGGQLTVMAHLFNVGALFILFRETVEGSVILSVLLRAVDKAVDDPIRANQLKWHVWAGVIVGGVISIFVGGGFAVAFWVLGKDVFGNSKGVWEGSFMLLASILLTWLAFGMLKVSNLYAKWEAKIAEHAVSALKKPDFFGFDEPTGKHAHHQNKYLDGLGSIKKPYRIITLHLGNGASACAALDGRSVDTSMGLTPLEGLIMGTRSGDVDASAIFHLSKPHFAAHASPEYDNIRISQAEDILNHASGLKGICGESDFKRIEEILSSPPSKDPGQGTRSNSKTDKLEKYRRTELAIKMFCYRIAKYVASYIVPLGGLPHAIVFSGGIGEHVPRVRRMTCEFLEGLVVKIDESTNDSPGEGDLVDITGKLSLCRVFIVKTDEEGELARHAKAFVD